MVTGGKLWWADEESAQLGTVTKRDGRNPVILRNKTSGVVHMKVYDREGQKGKRAHNTNTHTTHNHSSVVVYLLPLCCFFFFYFQEETSARSTTEDAHSSASQLRRTPGAAPALLATTCVATVCLVRVR